MTQDGLGGMILAVGFIIFLVGMAWAGSNISEQRDGRRAPTYIMVASVVVMLMGGLLVAPCEGGDCGAGELPEPDAVQQTH